MRACILVLSFGLVVCCSPTRWHVSDSDQGILILEGADSVLFYQQAKKSRNGEYERNHYIHPLYGLNGERLTEDFPDDHYHHRGIFWAWHQLYVGNESVGDPWVLTDFAWQVENAETSYAADKCMLHTSVTWLSAKWLDQKGAAIPLARESATLTIHPARHDYRLVDFDITIDPLVDSLRMGGSDNEKGYGGFSWRIPLSDDAVFTGPKGEVTPHNLPVNAGSWLDIRGSLVGNSSRQGITVISHRDNPGHPHPWILRKQKSMQNAAYPGQIPISISKNNPLRLRYRMVISNGNFDLSLVDELQEF